MFENIRAIACNARKKSANLSALILGLALLSGCSGVNKAQTELPAEVSKVCKADTDTFCLEGDKDSGVRLNNQGLEYAAKKDYDQALELFKRAIEMDNSNPEFHYNLGVTYSLKGMAEEEEAAYMDVLAIESEDTKLNPALADTYFNLACLYALQGKKDQAFAQLEKLLSLDSNKLYHYLQSDEDLKSLRDDPRYKQLVAKKPEEGSKPIQAIPAVWPGDSVEATPSAGSDQPVEAIPAAEASKPEGLSNAQEPAKPKKAVKSKKAAKSKKSSKSEVPAK